MRFLERGDPALRAQRDLENKLKDKHSQRDEKVAQLQTAESKLAEARAIVEQLALESDEAALDRALQARRGAEDKLAALRGAALAIGKEISDIEAQIDKVVDQRCRSETSIAVKAMADRIAKAQVAHEAAALELELAAKEGGLLIPESVAVHEFTRSAREQLVPAVEMVVGALKQHARGVLSGQAPASLPRPAAPAPVLTVVGPPPEPTMNVFLVRHVKFINATGGTTTAGKYKRADLPKKLAELALSSGVALAISDKRMHDLAQLASPLQPDETSCEWIGPPGKEAPVRSARPGGPVVHSQFEPHPDYVNAKPVNIVVPRGPEPEVMPLAVGARNAEDGES
jgi:hypothetical protein